jgi:tetratricopeptide (TPR) repeat protein
MEENIRNFLWENFTLLESNFTDKVIEKLKNLKEKDEKDIFYDYLELIFDMDNEILENIEKIYLENIVDSKGSMEEIVKLLELTSFDNFITKVKYIDIAELIINKQNTDSELLAKLYFNLAKIYYELANYDKAKELYEKALKIREEILGENHPDTASSYNNLGNIYSQLKNYDKAKDFNEKALKIREEILGENHPDTASSYNNLGNIYYRLKNYEKAKDFHEKALKIREEILGENHPDTASSYNNLGNIYSQLKNYDKAKELKEKALKIRKEILGVNHPDTANSYNSLGNIYYILKNYDKAKDFNEKALKIREEILGENHPDTASSYNNLGSIYYILKNYDKAKDFYEKALKIREEILGENHPDTASSYNSLGSIYYQLNNYEKAKELYEKSLKIREEILGENHPDTASSYYSLGYIYNQLKNNEKAKELYEKSLKIREEILGENHPDTASSYNNLGNIYYELANYEKAKELYAKVLRGMIISNQFEHLNMEIFSNNYKLVSRNPYFIDSNVNIEPYLKNVKIKNFKLLEDFEIDFSKNVNIIIGDNSSGKTSLLQAITLGLLSDKFIGENNELYSKFITKLKDKSEIILSIDKYEKKVEITANERIIDNDVLSPFVLSYGSNIFTKYKIEVNDLVNELIEEKIDRDFTSSIFRDYTSSFYNPKSILNELTRINTPKSLEIRDIFFDTINTFLDDFSLECNSNNQYFFKHNNQIIFKLENLSEGYRNNILLVSDILIRILGIGKRPDTVEGIILIDEFDRHLHPKWQSNIVSKLLTTFPKIQFILTTHNPMTILDRSEDEITVIKEVDGKLVSQKSNGTKKIDVGTVLLKYFGVKSLVGKEMQDNLVEFTALKLKDALSVEDEKRLSELEEKLDETVATNFIYNKGYFKFLKFIKTHEDIDFEEIDDLSDEEMNSLLSDFEKSL